MLKAIAAASVIAIAFSAPVEARIHRGGLPSSATAPLLQNVAVPFGQSTPTSRGGVRLSSMDATSAAVKPQTFSGIDLQSPTAPACGFWTLTFVSNSAGRPSTDFTLPSAGVAEGTAAVTPITSSTGNGHLAGNYVWNVSCVGNGQSSNTVTLTYNTNANTATVGTADAWNFGSYPGSFGSVAGARIELAVGLDRRAVGASLALGAFTNQVTVTNADSARRPALSQFGITGGSPSNVLVDDLVLSGALDHVPTNSAFQISSSSGTVHDIIGNNIHFYGSEPLLGNNSGQGGVNIANCTANCGVQNSSFDYVESGYSPTANTFLHNVSFRYIYNNCIFLRSVNNVDLKDVKCLSPMQRYQGQHPDIMQIADGATPNNVTVQRFLASQADGDYFAQGPYFGGSLLSAVGYVDDGTGAHGPGNIFTEVPTVGGGSGWQGSTIAIPGVIAPGAGITIDCYLTSHVCSTGSSVFALIGLSPTNIGSAASPVNMYGVGTQNFQMSGIISAQGGPYGTAQQGNAGTSWTYDYDYNILVAQNPLISTFTGSVSGALLTSSTIAVSNISGNVGFISGGGRLNYAGCNFCFNGSVNSLASGAGIGPGTYNLQGSPGNTGAVTMQVSGVYAGEAAPYWLQEHCNNPDVQGGTLNIDRGLFQTGMGTVRATCVVGVNFPAANTTVGPHAFGPTLTGYSTPGGTVAAADYASGVLPEAYMSAHSWTASDTPDDILRITCLAIKPSLGGKRDAGGGLGYSAITPATNANGTGGGDWMIYNGTSHIASTHISGCEVAP